MPDSSWFVSLTLVSVSFNILRLYMMIFFTKMAEDGVLASNMAIPMNVAHLHKLATIKIRLRKTSVKQCGLHASILFVTSQRNDEMHNASMMPLERCRVHAGAESVSSCTGA